MTKIVSIQSNINEYILTGSIDSLNKKDIFHLKRVYKAEKIDNRIIINKGLNENPKIISELNDFFFKRDIQLELDGDADIALSNLYEEEQKFQEFSIKAKMIWQNQHKPNEFYDFCKILSEKMFRTLYELQLLSAHHLAFSQNSCNFSVPGSGKTSIVYAAYTYLKNLDNSSPKYVDKILIIGPLSCFGPWEDEYRECFNVEVNKKRITSNMSVEEKNNYFYSQDTSEVTLISYQGVLSQINQLEFFLKNNNVMVILDEAHKIKNTNGGQIAEAVLSISKFCKSRVVLTGTPAPNGYRDLTNLFQFIWPTKQLIPYSAVQLDDMTQQKNDSRIPDLIDRLTPYFVRIKKSDLKLPPKIEHPLIRTQMDPQQKFIYETIEKKIMSDFLANTDYGVIQKFQKAKLIRLIQAASNPRLLLRPIEDNISEVDYNFLDNNNQKLVNIIKEYDLNKKVPMSYQITLEIIQSILSKNEKVVIWAIYIDSIHFLAEFLDSFGIQYRTLYGATPIENDSISLDIETRESIIREFNSNISSFNVIIANPFAVAESISLHKSCHNAIYLERNFDGARFVQSKDRIHRYGLPKNITTEYFYIASQNTISETIHQRLLEKEDLMIKVTESKDIPLFAVLEENDQSDIKVMIDNYVKRSNK